MIGGRVKLTRKEKEVVRRKVFERDQYRCVDCGIAVIWESGLWASGHLAHVVSKARGGPFEEWNLRTKCLGCHIGKEHGGGKPCPAK